jgi:hypothetical protein
MAGGHVQIDADDYAEIRVGLAAMPEIGRRLANIEAQLKKPVHQECVEHDACARAAFGARKFQYVLVGAVIVVNAIVIPVVVGLILR